MQCLAFFEWAHDFVGLKTLRVCQLRQSEVVFIGSSRLWNELESWLTQTTFVLENSKLHSHLCSSFRLFHHANLLEFILMVVILDIVPISYKSWLKRCGWFSKIIYRIQARLIKSINENEFLSFIRITCQRRSVYSILQFFSRKFRIG